MRYVTAALMFLASATFCVYVGITFKASSNHWEDVMVGWTLIIVGLVAGLAWGIIYAFPNEPPKSCVCKGSGSWYR